MTLPVLYRWRVDKRKSSGFFFSDVNIIQEGIGDKVGNLINTVALFFTSLALAFSRDWRLVLILLSLSPIMIISGGIIVYVSSFHSGSLRFWWFVHHS